MLTRTLPGTDLALSVIGLGTWALGGKYWGDDVTDARSRTAIEAALEAGVTWFDTAPIYGDGHAEELLVEVLGPRRHDVILATKVGVDTSTGHARSVLTPELLARDLHATLRRLRTDCLDLVQVHWPCEENTPLEVTYGALARLREEGLFRHLGVCNYRGDAVEEIARITPIVSLQTGYSLLRREVEQGTVAACARAGVGILAYEPLMRGLLTHKFGRAPTFPSSDMRSFDERFQGHRFAHAQRLASDLAALGARVGATAAQIAIGWVAARPGVTAVAVGAKDAEQVRENVGAARLVGHAKLWDVTSRLAAVHGGIPR
jgi:aryl-alcohol dehydrogenase-like predicted oxidoreductase